MVHLTRVFASRALPRLSRRALKQIVKQLFGPASPGLKGSAELEFKQELYNGIQAVNAFFIDKERELLSALPLHGGGGSSSSSTGTVNGTEAKDAFFGVVAELYAFSLLNCACGGPADLGSRSRAPPSRGRPSLAPRSLLVERWLHGPE